MKDLGFFIFMLVFYNSLSITDTYDIVNDLNYNSSYVYHKLANYQDSVQFTFNINNTNIVQVTDTVEVEKEIYRIPEYEKNIIKDYIKGIDLSDYVISDNIWNKKNRYEFGWQLNIPEGFEPHHLIYYNRLNPGDTLTKNHLIECWQDFFISNHYSIWK